MQLGIYKNTRLCYSANSAWPSSSHKLSTPLSQSATYLAESRSTTLQPSPGSLLSSSALSLSSSRSPRNDETTISSRPRRTSKEYTKPAARHLSLTEQCTTTNDGIGYEKKEKDKEKEKGKRGLTRSQVEKKLRRRQQNNESSRRVRERKRLEVEALQRAYVENQARISELEQLVQELSAELRKRNTTHAGMLSEQRSVDQFSQCRTNRSPSRSMSSERVTTLCTPDDRPGWFGAAF